MCFLELKFYQLFTGEERRTPFIFDDFHFCRSRIIGFDMTENIICTLCRMITWVVFLRMFWNFISSLPMKKGGSLSFLIGTISNVLVMEIGWKDVGSGGYILVSCAHSNTSILCHCMKLIYGRTLLQVAILMNWFIINLTHFCDKVSMNKFCTTIPQQCYCENDL